MLLLGIGNAGDAAEHVDVVSGPTAASFSPLPLASSAQQKQLSIVVHPACFVGHLLVWSELSSFVCT